jgi:hypothetical protein
VCFGGAHLRKLFGCVSKVTNTEHVYFEKTETSVKKLTSYL